MILSRLCVLPVLLCICAAVSQAQTDSGANASMNGSAFEKWIQRWGHERRTGSQRQHAREPWITATAVEGEEREPRNILEERFGTGYSYGCDIATTGEAWSFRQTIDRGRGGRLFEEGELDLSAVRALLSRLPEGLPGLPPAGRRLMIEVVEGNRTTRRIYDRANTPVAVRELLRLTKAPIPPWTLRSDPIVSWEAHRTNPGALTVSPDGKLIVSGSRHEPIKLWDSRSYELVRTVTLPDRVGLPCLRFAYNPDGTRIAITADAWLQRLILDTRSWEVVKQLAMPPGQRDPSGAPLAQFTPDGAVLLIQSFNAPMSAYNSADGESRLLPKDVPESANAYVQARINPAAIASLEGGDLVLWDPIARKPLALLDREVQLRQAVFSADESLVAVITVQKKAGVEALYRLRIWDAETGSLLNELFPDGRVADGEINGVAWTPDGQYLLASENRENRSLRSGLCIWNAQTGRHRGTLNGPTNKTTGLEIFDSGRRAVVGGEDGRIYVWDLEAALKTITAFEESLVPVPQD